MSADHLTSILTVAVVLHEGEDRQRVALEIYAEFFKMTRRSGSSLSKARASSSLAAKMSWNSKRCRREFLKPQRSISGSRGSPSAKLSARQAQAEGRAQLARPADRAITATAGCVVEPNEPGKGYEFINEIKGGVVPKEYIKPIDMGVRGAMEGGILAGFPMVDVKVTLFDGSYHEVDSNENAFKIAGSIAFKEAAHKAKPVLLEPVMAVEAAVPEEYMGVIIGDINSRRGRIEGMEHAAGSQVIKAMVPLAELLRSSRYGRPEYSMRFARYEPVPRSHGFGDDAAPVFAVRPHGPTPRDRSTSVRPDDQ